MKNNSILLYFSCTMALFFISGCSPNEEDILAKSLVSTYKGEKAKVEDYAYIDVNNVEQHCHKIVPSNAKQSNYTGWFTFCVEEHSNRLKAKKAFFKIATRELKAPSFFLLHKNCIYQIETYCANEDAMKSIIATLLFPLEPDESRQENILLVECGGRIVPYEKIELKMIN